MMAECSLKKASEATGEEKIRLEGRSVWAHSSCFQKSSRVPTFLEFVFQSLKMRQRESIKGFKEMIQLHGQLAGLCNIYLQGT